MPDLSILQGPTVTVATMTLLLDRVREIPALTGDMRPRRPSLLPSAQAPLADTDVELTGTPVA